MTHKAPGKSDREGVALVQLADMFPTEESAREWFESRICAEWPALPCIAGAHAPTMQVTTTCHIAAPTVVIISVLKPAAPCTIPGFRYVSGCLRSICI